MQLDVTEGFISLNEKLEKAAALFGRIDVVVNNAGISMMAFVEEGGCVAFRSLRPCCSHTEQRLDDDRSGMLRKQCDVNLFGLLDVTQAALPHLRARRCGTIVHIGSRVSWKPEIPVSALPTC